MIKERRERVQKNCIFQMTGLEVETCHILEVACFITDQELQLTSDYLNIVIHQSDEVLKNMSEWCKLQHRKVIIFPSSPLILFVLVVI